jgi:hypothetical protein
MQTKFKFKYYLFTLKNIYKIVTQNFSCFFIILTNSIQRIANTEVKIGISLCEIP